MVHRDLQMSSMTTVDEDRTAHTSSLILIHFLRVGYFCSPTAFSTRRSLILVWSDIFYTNNLCLLHSFTSEADDKLKDWPKLKAFQFRSKLNASSMTKYVF